MKVLIIGGNGFIGSHLVETLRKDHEIIVFDRSPNKFLKEFFDVEYVYGDFENKELLNKSLKGVDIVYHLLSTTVPLTANQSPVYDVQTNLIGTLNLLELIGKSDVQRIIYTSSGGTVYGNPQYLPIDEEHQCEPIGSYGVTKLAIEKYIKLYASRYDFSYLIVRPSNPYGPRQNYTGNQGIISALFYRSFYNEEFNIWGNGTAVRDYIYIDDLTNFLKISGLSSISGIFNVGSGCGHSVNNILKEAQGILEVNPKINYKPGNDFGVKEVILDIHNSRETFNWKPRIGLKEGMVLHYNWLKSILKNDFCNR